MSLEINDVISDMKDNSEHVEMLEDDAVIERMAEGDEEGAVDSVMNEAAGEMNDLIAELERGLRDAREARDEIEHDVRQHVGGLAPEYQRHLHEQTMEERA